MADRIGRGALPVEEALSFFKDIAEALEAAHEKGVIHRDLKPANIKITPEAKVKVLDFGLAKAFEHEQATVDSSQSPTLTKGTAPGAIMGTASYMSPEQARGKPVDKRSDIFSFGCVLYEMLAGRPAFRGGTISDILAAILKSEPEWDRLPADIPWKLCELIRGCLEKDPRERWRDIGDVRREIKNVGVGDGTSARTTQSMGARKIALMSGFALAACVLTGMIVWNL